MRALPLAGAPPPASPDAPRGPVAMLGALGFRPFFLAAGLFAIVVVPLWLAVLRGVVHLPAARFAPMAWHAHEMVFGFASAVVAGFLLTATKNWTGRDTARGPALHALGGLWLAGRVAVLLGGALPGAVVLLVDGAFLPAVAVAVARPLIATKNHRNLVLVAVLAALAAANVASHLGALGVLPGFDLRGPRAGVDLVVVLSVVIGGRVIPMFTRNATGDATVGSELRLDRAANLTSLAAALGNVVAPGTSLAAALAFTAALALTLRGWRWRSRRIVRHPLLWVLHLGTAWIVVGLVLRAASTFTAAVPASAATHALTVGAIGGLCLGMMARVSLGHTGRPIAVGRLVAVSFALLHGAALVRVFGPLLLPIAYGTWLVLAGALWTAAFAVFVVRYAPILLAPRVDGREG